MKAVFKHSQIEAENIHSFWFQPEKPVRYTAGQFTEVHILHKDADERGDKRWFTLSSSPANNLISITTKFTPHKSSSFKKQLLGLQPGDVVSLTEPMGDFVLPQQSSIPVVFVAGGIGITPMYSMTKWLDENNQQRDVYLLYAANSSAELAFNDFFKGAPITYAPMISQPEADWQYDIGRITSQHILDIPNVSKNALVYISGPEPMVEQLNKELLGHGLPAHRVIGDYFPGYPAI